MQVEKWQKRPAARQRKAQAGGQAGGEAEANAARQAQRRLLDGRPGGRAASALSSDIKVGRSISSLTPKPGRRDGKGS